MYEGQRLTSGQMMNVPMMSKLEWVWREDLRLKSRLSWFQN